MSTPKIWWMLYGLFVLGCFTGFLAGMAFESAGRMEVKDQKAVICHCEPITVRDTDTVYIGGPNLRSDILIGDIKRGNGSVPKTGGQK